MNLIRSVGTIGGLTMVSRVFGFARDMIAARVLGAGAAAEVFVLALLIPNLFRRMFGEGAFSSGFVPLFSKRIGPDGETVEAQRFAEETFAVFAVLLMAITAFFMIFMPAFIALVVPEDWGGGEAKTLFAVDMTRLTMPYMVLICLVSLLSGVLNSLHKFAAAAFAPALLNIALVAALLLAPEGGVLTVRAMAISVLVGGVLQFALCWWAVRRAGIRLKLRLPKITPGVRELFTVTLPATLAGGVYYISQVFYAYFATRLPEGTLVYLGNADRLNQLPLAIIGSALGTAILPSISRAVDAGDGSDAGKIQGQALDLAMLLTIPASIALAILAEPIAFALFQGGRYDAEDARWTGLVLAIIVAGLPAYVLIKVLAPGFYARKDVRTPVVIAMSLLVVGVLMNFALLDAMGIATLPFTTAFTAWLNALVLYALLHARGHFRLSGPVSGRVLRQLLAGGAMGAALWAARVYVFDRFIDGSTTERFGSLLVMVALGGAVYFAVGWLVGAYSRDDILTLIRRRKPHGG